MAKKKGARADFSKFDSGYYEPFAGYYNSTVDQEKYWIVIACGIRNINYR